MHRVLFIKQKKHTMKNLTNWLVWVTKESQPLTISVPFHNVTDAHEFIWEQIGKRPVSIAKI